MPPIQPARPFFSNIFPTAFLRCGSFSAHLCRRWWQLSSSFSSSSLSATARPQCDNNRLAFSGCSPHCTADVLRDVTAAMCYATHAHVSVAFSDDKLIRAGELRSPQSCARIRQVPFPPPLGSMPTHTLRHPVVSGHGPHKSTSARSSLRARIRTCGKTLSLARRQTERAGESHRNGP